MTKKLYIGALCAFASTALLAQPTIEMNDFTPEYGTQVSLRGASSYEEQEVGGEDLTWDYSELNGSGNITIRVQTVVEPDGQPAAESYPTATHVYSANNINSGISDYKEFGDNEIELLGRHFNLDEPGDPDLIDYTDPRTELVFPLSYGDTFTDTYENQQSNSVAEYYETAEFTATVDAWGTLILPEGTFEDVLRVRYDITGEFTSIEFDVEETVSLTETSYAYYKAGIALPLMVAGERVQGESTFLSTRFYDPTTIGIEEVTALNNVSLYPSPANDFLHVELDLVQSSDVTVEIYDMTGKRVLLHNEGASPAGANVFSLPVSSLASGVYVATVRTQKGNITKRFVVEP